MRDITEDVKKAMNQNVLWSINLFYALIETLKNNNIAVSYWENEENWATLIFCEKPVGYLWKKYPVLFLECKHFASLRSSVQTFPYLSVINVNSLNEENLKLDYTVLNNCFEYGVAYNQFSATDLWFQTNSI